MNNFERNMKRLKKFKPTLFESIFHYLIYMPYRWLERQKLKEKLFALQHTRPKEFWIAAYYAQKELNRRDNKESAFQKELEKLDLD